MEEVRFFVHGTEVFKKATQKINISRCFLSRGYLLTVDLFDNCVFEQIAEFYIAQISGLF